MIDPKIEKDLINKIKLDPIQAKLFLLVTTEGSMTPKKVAKKLKITVDVAIQNANELVKLGAFIELNQEFEAMHPRFTAVNMYRKMCEKKRIKFERNNVVDNIGTLLERQYENARTK